MNKLFVTTIITFLMLISIAKSQNLDEMKARFKDIKYSVDAQYSAYGPSFNITINFPPNFFDKESKITVQPTFTGITDVIPATQKYVGEDIIESGAQKIPYSTGGSYSIKVYPKLTGAKGGDLKLAIVLTLETKGVTPEVLKPIYFIDYDIEEGKSSGKIENKKVVIDNKITDDNKTDDNKTDDNKTTDDNKVTDTVKVDNGEVADILKDIDKYKKTGNTEKLAELNEQLGDIYASGKDYDKAKEAYLEAIKNSKKNDTPVKTGDLYTNVGKVEYITNNKVEAITDYYQALEYYKTEGDSKRAELTYNNLATIYNSMSFYEKAVDAYKDAIENAENTATIAKYSSKIADTYRKMEDLKQTAEFYEKTIRFEKENKNNVELITSYSNASSVYLEMADYDKAAEYINAALDLNEEVGAAEKQPMLFNNLGNINFSQNNFDEALKNYKKALEKSIEQKNRRNEAITYHNLGIVYFERKEIPDAKSNFVKSNEIAQAEGYNDLLAKNMFMFSKIVALSISSNKDFAEFQDFLIKGSPHMYAYDMPMSDYQEKYSFATKTKEELIEELTMKEQEIREQQESIEKQKLLNKVLVIEKDAESTKNKHQRRIIWSMAIALLVVIVFALIALREYILKKRAYGELQHKNAQILQQKEEIQTQADELLDKNEKITEQNVKIQSQNDKINSSMEYAKNIQNAILPATNIMNASIDNFFVMYMPREYVSGDFYWFSKISEDEYIVAAADCTGHGVPGAMMSMLGMALLNEIVNAFRIYDTNRIADNLREMVIKSLNQDINIESERLTKDGMDIAILKVNKKLMKAYFTGAENPLILVRNSELTEYKADGMPIGATVFNKVQKEFSMEEVALQKDDMLYIFSDGYVDQFGGPRHKKFFKRSLYDLFIAINNLELEEQKQTLITKFYAWKDWNKNISNRQIDDILIMGIKI